MENGGQGFLGIARQGLIGVVGAFREGAFDAAEGFVGVERELAGGIAVFIEFAQDELDERQEFRMGGGILEDAAGQRLVVAVFKREPGEAGGFLDQALQGIRAGRQDIELAVAGLHADQRGFGLDVLIEITAHGGQHPDAAAAGEGFHDREEGRTVVGC